MPSSALSLLWTILEAAVLIFTLMKAILGHVTITAGNGNLVVINSTNANDDGGRANEGGGKKASKERSVRNNLKA